jgi:hypothetical protein
MAYRFLREPILDNSFHWSLTWGSKLQVAPKTAMSRCGFRQAQEKVAKRINAILERMLNKSFVK